MSERCTVRPMIEDDIPVVLVWRNHEDVRRYMFSQHKITLEEHQSWFNRSSQDPAKALLIFEKDGKSMGFIQLSFSKCLNIADWGFYVSPEAPKGTGRQLCTAALCYCFQQLRLHKVCGHVLSYNKRSIHLHLAMGFKQEGLMCEHYFDGERYHDVYCYGLLASEWNQGILEEQKN